MYRLGRLLQLFGLIVLPCSVLMQVSDQLTVRQSLLVSSFGVIAFYLGYLLQGIKTN